MNTIFPIAIFVGLIVLIIFLVRKSKKMNKKKTEYYQSIALKWGLTHNPSKKGLLQLNNLTGNFQGFGVKIYEKVVGHGKNQHQYTCIDFNENPFSFEFSISKEHFFSKMGKMVGFKDIEFDDHEFDKTFLLKSKDEDQFRRLIDYKIQADLKEISPSIQSTIHNKKGVYSYQIMGVLHSDKAKNDFETVFNFMITLAKKANA